MHCEVTNIERYLTSPASTLTDITLVRVPPLASIPFGGHVPQLRTLRLEQASYLVPELSENLTNVYIGSSYIELHALLEWLKGCPQLEHLSTRDAIIKSDTGAEQGNVHLSRLHRVSMNNAAGHTTCALFSGIILDPSSSVQISLPRNDKLDRLESMRCAPLGNPTDLAFLTHRGVYGSISTVNSRGVYVQYAQSIQSHLLDMPIFQSHLADVQNIWVVDRWPDLVHSVRDAAQIIRGVPAATSLTIDSRRLSDYLDHLSGQHDGQLCPLLPTLTSVHILFRSNDDTAGAKITAFAASRAELGYPLSSLSISYAPDYHDTVHNLAPILEHVESAESSSLGVLTSMTLPAECCSSAPSQGWVPWSVLWKRYFPPRS